MAPTSPTLLAIISYGFSEAADAIQRANLRLHTLTDFDSLLDVAVENGALGGGQVATIRNWLDDPYNWAAGAR